MHKLARYLIALVFLPVLAFAQSSPGLYNGQVPTAAQWNSYFQKKQDYPVSGYCLTGTIFANMSGLTAPASCTAAANVLGVGSALKWTTARTLSLTGAVTGSATIDGSGNVSLATSGGGSGTVTSVAVTLPATFSCTGSPVTTSGTIACTLATQSANTVLAGPTSGGAATPAYRALVAADLPATAVTPASYTAANITVDQQGRITAASSGSAGGASSPQGRLTLVTGTPVMASDQTAKSQVFYDCYRGKQVPYYDGSTDQTDTITACEVSLTMATSSTGVTNSGGVFDVYWVHSGASRVCVVTNGSGGGWASDTAGSNTARGTGYSAVHNTRGYWTNTNALTHCYNGATDYGSVSADQGTYLGTLYTSAAGQTGIVLAGAGAVGGTPGLVYLWNAYNRQAVTCRVINTTSSWNPPSTSWGPRSGSSNDRCTTVDGLAQSRIYASLGETIAGTADTYLGVDVDSTSATPACSGQAGSVGNGENGVASCSSYGLSGLHFYQAVDGCGGASSGCLAFGVGGLTSAPIAWLLVSTED